MKKFLLVFMLHILHNVSNISFYKALHQVMVLADNSDSKVAVNHQPLQFSQPPVIINGTTLVPLRGIFEALREKVDWDQPWFTRDLLRNHLEKP